MKTETVRLSAISDESAAKGQYDRDRLRLAVTEGTTFLVGTLNVTVQRNESKDGFELWGDYPVFDESDPDDLVNVTCEKLLGKSLREVALGQGLSLEVNKLAREEFIVRKGRGTDNIGKAMSWASVHAKDVLAKGIMADLMSAWTAAGRP